MLTLPWKAHVPLETIDIQPNTREYTAMLNYFTVTARVKWNMKFVLNHVNRNSESWIISTILIWTSAAFVGYELALSRSHKKKMSTPQGLSPGQIHHWDSVHRHRFSLADSKTSLGRPDKLDITSPWLAKRSHSDAATQERLIECWMTDASHW